MTGSSNFSAFGISMAMHGIILVALGMIQQNLMQEQPKIQLETVFEEERVQEEFSQELEVETEVAETQNTIAGGAVTSAIGGSGAPAVAQEKIDTAESLEEPTIQVNASNITLPGEAMLGQDLGEGEINGEVGAYVEGYGAALGRITQELIRMMRENKVMVVWLFDESGSMKDDQQEIAQKFHKVYEELGIQSQTDEKLRGGEVLSTLILGFGEQIHPLTPKPTGDVNEIRAAIDKIAVDESGEENMCQSIAAVIDKYGPLANSQKRKLVIVIVSDESPSDDAAVEEAIQRAERARSPVYILGREAIFGYPYARVRWKDPVYGLNHWVRINRGPETAFPEALQYDGFRARWDSFSSGFGPYSQVRISKETGGIFFVLPGEEENLDGPGSNLERQFDALNMREYEPLLLPRREYAEQRDRSKFRSRLWDIIVALNPHLDNKLNINWWFTTDPKEFGPRAKTTVEQTAYAMGMINKALDIIEEIRPLREREESTRWRANFDLIYAQLVSYKVRQFQFLLAMDKLAQNGPDKVKDPKSNRWHFGRTKVVIEPDEEQFERLKRSFGLKMNRTEYLAMLKEELKRAEDAYLAVEAEHPGTPWAQRALWERNNGNGVLFNEYYHDPRYDDDRGKRIVVPKF